MNKHLITVGEHTKKVRLALGLTQKEFSREFNKKHPRDLKINRVLMSKYERGKVTMPADKYLKIIAMNPIDNPL